MKLPPAVLEARADPKAPRERDRARPVPRTGGGMSELDDAKILAAPDDPRDWPDWRRQLHRWRDEARSRVAYDGGRYERPALAWTQRCFSLCLAWLWDEQLYDRATHRFTPDAFLASDADLGGYDAIVLWHTYPLIGIDERDQFDLYRDTSALPALVAAFHQRGVRVLLEYQAWDTGRHQDRDDAAELVAVASGSGADGIFLDTIREAPAGVRAALDAAGRDLVLEGESNIPLARIADHEMSWAQWQADSPTPGVLRAKWFEQRHMLHQTRRWDRDRTAQLRTAWLNGAGMLVWENVFGSWVGWSPRDKATLTSMLAVQRRFGRRVSLAAAHGSGPSRGGTITRWGRRMPSPRSRVRGSAGSNFCPVASSNPGCSVLRPASPCRRSIVRSPRCSPSHPARSMPACATSSERALCSSGAKRADFRAGRTGTSVRPPLLHRIEEERHELKIDAFAISPAEVTNAEFARFVASSRYQPAVGERFLAHWRDGAPDAGTDHEPVRYVDLDDARAYASWAGLRLPTEFEWQIGAADPSFVHREPRVWNWTESEHTDGRTRYAILKGGSRMGLTGSDWYTDAGPQPPEVSLKWLRAGPSIERSAAIGFRCATDLAATASDD